MNVEEAWDEFSRTSSIKKTSVKGMLDTISAQLNEIQQTSSRTAELVPKILGDNAAIDTANEEAGGDMMSGPGGPAPDMEEDPGMGTPDMGIPTDDMVGGEPPMTDEENMPIEGTEEVPFDEEKDLEGLGDEGAPEVAGPEEEPSLGEEDGTPIGDILEDVDNEEIDDTGTMGAPDETPIEGMVDMSAGVGERLKALAKEMIDEGRFEDAKALIDATTRFDEKSDVEETLDVDEEIDTDLDDEDTETPIPDTASEETEVTTEETEDVDETEDDEAPAKKSEGIESASNIGMTDGTGDFTASEGENGDVKTKVGEIMGEAVSEVMDIIDGKEPEESEESEEEIDVEDVGESEDNEEKNEEIIEEDAEHIEDCNDGKSVYKSATDVTFRELLEAKMRGEDAFAPFVKSDVEEITDFAEFDPWGQNKFNMFKKNSETIADEVSDASVNIQGDAKTGGDQLDDVDEEKGMSEGSTEGGDKLDEVTTERPSGTSGQGGDMLDEVSKEDGAKNSQSETEDLLDTVDQKQPTCTSGEGGDMLDDVSTKKSADMNGKQIPTLRDMMAIRKSGRPDAISSVNGDIERPELGKITKSQSSPVRMGRGVDPKKVTENDWNEYNLFKSRQTF